MPRSSTVPRTDHVSRALARDRLGVPAVVFFVMSAAAPLTVVAGVVPTGFAVTGITGIPLAFLVVGAVLVLFSVGYVTMARHVAHAGAFSAYVARGLGRPLGVGAAWMALLAYNCLQTGLYGAIGAAAGPLLGEWFGVRLPWWLVAFVAWALVASLGVLRVDVNGTVLAVLMVAEVAVIVVFDAADLLRPAHGVIRFDTLSVDNLLAPGLGAVLALAVLGFVGFESAAVFSEESRDPRRTVPIATYTSVLLIAGLYAVSAWAMTVAAGPDEVVDLSRERGPEIVFSLASAQLGGAAADVGHALFLTSVLAAMISFHNTTARYAFALGREGVLPRRLGETWRRTGAPAVGSLLQSGFGIVVIAVYAYAGWDPLVQLFFWAGTGGGYGVLLLVTLTSVAVIIFFRREPRGESCWRRAGAPVLAAAALLVIAYLATAHIDVLLGVPPGHWLRYAVPGAYAAVALAGVVWGIVLRFARPQTYARIGLGAKAATSALGLNIPQPRRSAEHARGTGRVVR